jgi:hypothetical protein
VCPFGNRPGLEGRHLVADCLGRVGCGGPDRFPQVLERGAHGRWLGGQVIVDAVRGGHGLSPSRGHTLLRDCDMRDRTDERSAPSLAVASGSGRWDLSAPRHPALQPHGTDEQPDRSEEQHEHEELPRHAQLLSAAGILVPRRLRAGTGRDDGLKVPPWSPPRRQAGRWRAATTFVAGTFDAMRGRCRRQRRRQ